MFAQNQNVMVVGLSAAVGIVRKVYADGGVKVEFSNSVYNIVGEATNKEFSSERFTQWGEKHGKTESGKTRLEIKTWDGTPESLTKRNEELKEAALRQRAYVAERTARREAEQLERETAKAVRIAKAQQLVAEVPAKVIFAGPKEIFTWTIGTKYIQVVKTGEAARWSRESAQEYYYSIQSLDTDCNDGFGVSSGMGVSALEVVVEYVATWMRD